MFTPISAGNIGCFHSITAFSGKELRIGRGVGIGADGGEGRGTYDGSGAGDGGNGMGGICSGEGDGEGLSMPIFDWFICPFFVLSTPQSVRCHTTRIRRAGVRLSAAANG